MIIFLLILLEMMGLFQRGSWNGARLASAANWPLTSFATPIFKTVGRHKFASESTQGT